MAASKDQLRVRTAIAIAVWSLLPLTLAVLAAEQGGALAAVVFGGVAAGSLAAAALARSSARRSHLVAVALLVALWIPFAVHTVRRFVFASGAGALAVAHSPLPFVIGAVVESFFVVPLAAFALGVWRRRAPISSPPSSPS
ncbi:MAG TPA: hypothetical protein VJ276_21410 [Thermoanaerobaculia bacterium]|nr:hypothetical protein [Thermoanaerobaculia bacterium]